MINKVILIGNLGKDPEVRRLETGTAVAKFPIATNENYKDKNGEWQKNTEWHDIVAWRYNAEMAERDLKKGKLVYVEGKLTHRKYQDKEGNDRYITEVVANVLRLLEKREGGSSFTTNNFPSEENAPAPVVDNSVDDSVDNSVDDSSVNKPVADTSSSSTEPTVVDQADDDLPF